MSEFKDKVVLITGAGLGVGSAVAEAFAARQAVVAANDLMPVNLDETLARILSKGARAKDYIFDIAKRMPVQAMLEQVVKDWGRIDVLVNSASVKPRKALLDIDEWDWHRTLDVNLTGPFYLIQLAGRVMREQGGGVIVNIIPEGCAQASKDHSAFIASKMGLLGLTRAAALELAPFHIRVNAVCSEVPDAQRPPWEQEVNRISSEDGEVRLGLLDEVIDKVLFLCSDAAAHITGQILNLDGESVMS